MTVIRKQVTEDERQERLAFFDAVLDATPQQIENYINNNVTDLASAKQVLIKLAKIVVFLAKREREQILGETQ